MVNDFICGDNCLQPGKLRARRKTIVIYTQDMRKTIKVEQTSSIRILSAGIAGAVASFLTQPLEVMKTNRINSPALLYQDIHKQIIKKGWKQYMRGSSIAVVRQAYGFTFYTQLLTRIEHFIGKSYPALNKFVNYSISSVAAKLVAMIFEAPLTLLKTRVQCMESHSVMAEFKKIMVSPYREYLRGLGSSVARQGFYTLFHYTTYRYLKDDFFLSKLNKEETFIPAFIAGVIAITVSQPFEVLRSQISLNKGNESGLVVATKYFKKFGIRGYFFGFIPRLVRKPINSGICWSIIEAFRNMQ